MRYADGMFVASEPERIGEESKGGDEAGRTLHEVRRRRYETVEQLEESEEVLRGQHSQSRRKDAGGEPMSEQLEQLANDLEDLIKDQGKEFIEEQGDAWKDFSQDVAQMMATQIFVAKTSDDDAKVADAQENIDLLKMSIELKLSESQLALVDNGQDMLMKVIGVIAKTALKFAVFA